MDERSLFIVIVDDNPHYFNTYAEFCNFMSENSHLVIERIEKIED